ncbi:MAG: 3-hydroxyacyl-CoA dehydrogenase NAD-binding domain-containing protein [Hymenobacter sp.]
MRSKRRAAGIEASLRKLTEKGKLTAADAAATLARLHFTTDMPDFADCGLVIEAIVEDLVVKQQVFKRVEEIVPAECILASNTSSLSITAIAAACQWPERFLGIHFFNPAPLMRLVEIIPAAQTRAGLAEEVKALVTRWTKRRCWPRTRPASS